MPDNSFRKEAAFMKPMAYGKGNALQNVFPSPLVWDRAPTTADTNFLIGQIIFDKVNLVFYQYAGSGTWQAISTQGGSGTFATLTVTGLSTLAALNQIGTTNINTSGAAVTTIGTGGTGAVNIGNATGNTSVTGSLTASTGLVATTGGITATAGDMTINGSGAKLRVQGGAVTDFIGTATLAAGQATVLNTNIAAGDHVLWSLTDINGSTAIGVQYQTTITPATSFVVSSLDATGVTETNDLSILRYVIIREI